MSVLLLRSGALCPHGVTPLPALTGVKFGHSQTMTFGLCSPPHVGPQGQEGPDDQALHISGALQF